MRRQELASAIVEVSKYIDGLKLRRLIGEKAGENALHSIKFAARHGHELSQNAILLLKEYKAEALATPESFEPLLKNNDRSPIQEVWRHAVFLAEHLPHVVSLLETDTDRFGLRNSDRVKIGASEFGIVRIIVPEEGGKTSDLSRYVDGLKSISELYKTISDVIGADGAELSLLSADSGSDKSFDLIGVAKTVKIVRKIIVEVWTNIAFKKELQTQKQLEAIVAASNAFAYIRDLQQTNKIDKDSEEKLKRAVTKSLYGMYKSGFYTEDMQDVRPNDVTEVIKYQGTKQISYSPADTQSEEAPSGPGSTKNDADDDIDFPA